MKNAVKLFARNLVLYFSLLFHCLPLFAEYSLPFKFKILQAVLAPDGSTYLLVQEYPDDFVARGNYLDWVRWKSTYQDESISPTIIRVLPDTNFDQSYGSYKGMYRLQIGGYPEVYASSMTLDTKGRLLISGTIRRYEEIPRPESDDEAEDIHNKFFIEGEGRSERQFITRLTPSGQPDSFGPNRNGITIVSRREKNTPGEAVADIGTSNNGTIHAALLSSPPSPHYGDSKNHSLSFLQLDSSGSETQSVEERNRVRVEFPSEPLIHLSRSTKPEEMNLGSIFSTDGKSYDDQVTIGHAATYNPQSGLRYLSKDLWIGPNSKGLAIDPDSKSMVVLSRKKGEDSSQTLLLSKLDPVEGTSQWPNTVRVDQLSGEPRLESLQKKPVNIVGDRITLFGILPESGILIKSRYSIDFGLQQFSLEDGRPIETKTVGRVYDIFDQANRCRDHFTHLTE